MQIDKQNTTHSNSEQIDSTAHLVFCPTIVSILPNELLGVVGDHGDMPIEALAATTDKHLMASTSHDNCVHFWALGWLFDQGQDEDEDAGVAAAGAASGNMDTSASEGPKVTQGGKKKKRGKKKGRGGFWGGV